MKFFFISLCFIFLFSCAEQIDIEATIDERAKKIANEMTHHGLDDEDFKDLIKKENPDIVGVSCMFTAQFENYLRVKRLIK